MPSRLMVEMFQILNAMFSVVSKRMFSSFRGTLCLTRKSNALFAQLFSKSYTLLQIRDGGGGGGAGHSPPPSPPKDETYPNKLYIIENGIYRGVQFILDIDKVF